MKKVITAQILRLSNCYYGIKAQFLSKNMRNNKIIRIISEDWDVFGKEDMKIVKGKERWGDVAFPTDGFLILSFPGIGKGAPSTQEAKETQKVTRFLPKVEGQKINKGNSIQQNS